MELLSFLSTDGKALDSYSSVVGLFLFPVSETLGTGRMPIQDVAHKLLTWKTGFLGITDL